MTLVVDASVAVAAALADGFGELASEELVAPPLMWSEGRSVLHELLWRGEIVEEDAEPAHASLETCPVRRSNPRRLGATAWRIAGELGWAKTYDAEYVALAQLLDARLITLDGRLERAAGRLVGIVRPAELG